MAELAANNAPAKCVLSEGETAYTVRGFRSLIDFQVTLRAGLNILVGPNGSGKTNLIEFLDFLDHLVVSGGANAVSSAGGIARVFSQETQTTQAFSLAADVQGFAQIADSGTSLGPTPVFHFSYHITLKFNKAASVLYIPAERIKFCQLSAAGAGAISRTSVGTLGVSRSSRSEDLSAALKLSPRLRDESFLNPIQLRSKFAQLRQIDQVLDQSVTSNLAPDESILGLRLMIPALDAVKAALTRGRVFNVIPERVRESEDLTRPPGIAKDGSGLASTLYYLQELKKGKSKRRLAVMRKATPSTLDTVEKWTKVVFRELQSINVQQDFHSGKFLGLVKVNRSDLTLPLQAVSDGTLKWLSLVTMVLTTGGIFSLEEPENFLHPKMQKYLIDLIRDNAVGRPYSFHCIVSTHSETVINECSADELLIFRFASGRTVCGRIVDTERVKREINRTGFGLGHYYANNALA